MMKAINWASVRIRAREWGVLAGLRCLAVAAILAGLWSSQLSAQTEQVMEVMIQDNTFITKQIPLILNVPVRIHVMNHDKIRHDFGSKIFEHTHTQVESGGVVAYGSSIGGVFLDGGKQATLQFTLHRPGQYEFKCSIHPNMKGEILLMSIGAV